MSDTFSSDAILARMLKNTDGGYNTDPGDLIYDVQKPVADELEEYHSQIEVCNNRHFADTAENEDLDAYVRQFGVIRKEATFAYGSVTFYGDAGAVIAVGDMVSDDSGILFYTTEAGTIGADGECTVEIICATPTVKGNIEAGKINKIPVTIKGITSVINSEATAGGGSRESDADLRERFYKRVQYTNVPGSKSWYENEAMSVEGVGDAKCIPTWNGGGTVKIIVLNSDKEAADAVVLERVRAHFSDPIVGATITIVTAEKFGVDISARLTLNAGYEVAHITESFMAAVEEYLKTISYDGGTIYLHKVGALLLNIDGVRDYRDLKLNGVEENIVISADDNYIPTVGVIDFE